MKISRELITGVITILAIGLLVTGVNFLKGNSFFGGDDVYHAYFQTSGGVTPATSVYVNGVDVGKVLSIEYLPQAKDSTKRVKITFNITTEGLQLPKGTEVEAGGVDLLAKGLTLHLPEDHSNGYYASESTIPGYVSKDIATTIEEYVDPLQREINKALVSIKNMVDGVSVFWEESATSDIEESMKEIKIAIRKFGNAADQIEGLLVDERSRLGRIMNNVEQITVNLKKSNDSVKAIVGNVKRITDDMVTADFKTTITEATETIKKVNALLDSANNGEGTLGKLVSDEELYNSLVKTNESLQNMLNDLTLHPERYIHFSVFGSKTKNKLHLTPNDEQKLRKILDSTQTP